MSILSGKWKTEIRRIFASVLFICFFGTPVLAGASSTHTLIYGFGMPDIGVGKGGLPSLAGKVDEARAAGETFFFFGGASLGPSMLASLDKGSHYVDLLNMMEPDAIGIAKRELVFGEDELAMRSRESFTPFVLSNARDGRTALPLEGIEEYLLVERQGMSLGIIVLLGEKVLSAYPPKYLELLDNEARVTQAADALREQGADFLVLQTDFMWEEAENYLERGVVDIVIASDGRSNRVIPTSRGLYAYLHGNGHTGLQIGLPDMDVNFFTVAECPPSSVILERAESYLTQMEKILDVEVGMTMTALDTQRSTVRTKEAAFGNLVADVMRESFSSDLALINGGVIRGGRLYEPGTVIYRRDLRAEFPFQNELALIRLSGRQVLAALENALSLVDEAEGRFPHVSGMRVTYKPSLPPGTRVVSVTVGDKPLQLDKIYTLTTSDYLADGGDGFTMFAEAGRQPAPSILIGDVVRIYVDKAGKIAPRVDNRMLALP